jgi:hypothetical protein
LARTNYNFEKRQKEIARKKKQEEKRQRKVEKGEPEANGELAPAAVDQEPSPADAGLEP